MCHRVTAEDHLFSNLPRDPQAAADSLKDLTSLFPVMPDLKLSENERRALVQWVNTQRPAPAAATKGGN
jgi:hypothetical protein